MKIDRPTNATVPDLLNYLEAMHACAEQAHEETTGNVAAISHRLRIRSWGNLLALIGIVLALGGAVLSAAAWFARTDAKLDVIAQLVADGHARDSRLDQITGQLAELQVMTRQNNDALLGADSAANPHPKKAHP